MTRIPRPSRKAAYYTRRPSIKENEVRAAFAVEGEISRHVLTKYSPHAQLVAFDINNDLGIFRLQNQYPDQKDFVDINWLLEREEAYHNQLPVEEKTPTRNLNRRE